jgi:hypothetical protein
VSSYSFYENREEPSDRVERTLDVPNPEPRTMVRTVHVIALVGVVGTLVASIWVYRIDRSLPSPGADGAVGRGDPAVVSLVEEPFTSVEEAYRKLRELERLFRTRGDRRAVFLTVYARVTREVAAGIERDEFGDPAWVADYLVTFADFYRRALLDFETGDVESVPDAWRLFFRATAASDALVVQCAVLGINAHVNYDLALALREVGIDRDRASKYRDHRRINEILWRLVDETLDRLAETYAPGIATFADLTGPVGEWVWYLALALGREGAWWIAVTLTESRWGFLRGITRSTMAGFSTVVAYLVLGPNGHPFVLDSLREWEASARGC